MLNLFNSSLNLKSIILEFEKVNLFYVKFLPLH